MIRVLIVEDSPVAAALLDHIFEADPDITVIGIVRSGAEALKYVKRDVPDVITMDINLPDMDGYEATRRIMSIHPVPVVVITGSVPREDVAAYFKAIDSGAVSVLQKPTGLGAEDHAQCAEKLVRTVKEMAGLQVGYRRAGSW